ncbi:MAG: hypothetical protein SGJ24_05655 [Chloroflexota bacterium]|nr:hypothetical protein [Chloroflexota bacterium]
MKIPPNAPIAREKLTQYLLVLQLKNDKSLFLAKAGFTQENPDVLERAIRQQLVEHEAAQDRIDEYGVHFIVTGMLRGTITLAVITVWIYEPVLENFRFIMLKPFKE